MVILKNIFFVLFYFCIGGILTVLESATGGTWALFAPHKPNFISPFLFENWKCSFLLCFSFVIIIFKLVPAPFTLHVQSLGWSPDYLVNHLTDHKSRVTPNSLQGFYLSCLQMFGNTDAKIEDGNLSVGSCHTLTVCVCVHAGWDVVVRACVSVSSARDCVFAMKTTQH